MTPIKRRCMLIYGVHRREVEPFDHFARQGAVEVENGVHTH